MAGNVKVGVRATHFAVLMLGLAGTLAALPAAAANCPRPDALGTSRTLVVDAKEHPLIGSMQYRETLPLNDGEVVLTFDDGPLPKYSYQILEILAAQCVKATFFLVGNQAKANPEGVRKVLAAGHTIATHSQTHPTAMHRLPLDRSKAEIDGGIASVTAALGDQSAALSPFFRIPGLARNDGIEEYTRSKGLQIWSADFPADDWRHVSSARVHDLAMQRLKAKGKGILLLHDIQPRTVAALPKILQDLKAGGYRIVHVVAATPDNPATPTDPQQWRLYPTSELVATSRWPKVPSFAFMQHELLPAPLLTDSYWNDVKLLDRPQARGRSVPLPRPAPWPRELQLASIDPASALPVPSTSVFEVEEGVRVAMLGVNATQQEERRVVATAEEKPAPAARPGKRKPTAAGARSRRVAAAPQAKPSHAAAQTGRRATARPAPDKKNVRRGTRPNQQASM
ncbi:MAG: polysaccharide deacetylase family protein [Bradyrhizobium sp.]|nr:polysaccharide deacetylase family protein [Bradyrhizobium sp.]